MDVPNFVNYANWDFYVTFSCLKIRVFLEIFDIDDMNKTKNNSNNSFLCSNFPKFIGGE